MAYAPERRTQLNLLLVVVLFATAAWTITYLQVRNMGLLMSLGVPMSMGMAGWADLTSFTVFTGMWLVMMVAMMLPSTYPTLLLHRTIYRKRHAGQRGGTLAFSLAYFLTWTATGILFFAAYVLIGRYRSSIQPADLILRAAGGALALAGLYQYSPLKMSCLRHCQNPLAFIMHHWKDGRLGGFRMGVTHGLYCFGCCWGLMLILFVMGIMDIGWMVAIGAIILLEKVVPSAKWIPRLVGATFTAVGILVMIFPQLLANLSSQVIN